MSHQYADLTHSLAFLKQCHPFLYGHYIFYNLIFGLVNQADNCRQDNTMSVGTFHQNHGGSFQNFSDASKGDRRVDLRQPVNTMGLTHYLNTLIVLIMIEFRAMEQSLIVLSLHTLKIDWKIFFLCIDLGSRAINTSLDLNIPIDQCCRSSNNAPTFCCRSQLEEMVVVSSWTPQFTPENGWPRPR